MRFLDRALYANVPKVPAPAKATRRLRGRELGGVPAAVACNRRHGIDERCARWLLATRDRVGGESFVLTHDFLPQLLGARRASVTVAAGMLQQAGLIS